MLVTYSCFHHYHNHNSSISFTCMRNGFLIRTFPPNKQDMSGAPVPKEEESVTPVSKLPWFNFNNQSHGYLACLHPVKGNKRSNYEPFSPLENKLTWHRGSLEKDKSL